MLYTKEEINWHLKSQCIFLHYLILTDLKGTSSESVKESLGQPKKTTWASIASQPAKPQLTVQNQGLKKKGPGMPPGPIIPGKHNMDIGTWDTSKSTPPQVIIFFSLIFLTINKCLNRYQ